MVVDPYPTLLVEALAHVSWVDHLVDVKATLTAEEPASPPASTERVREEEQKSIRTDFSLKRT